MPWKFLCARIEFAVRGEKPIFRHGADLEGVCIFLIFPVSVGQFFILLPVCPDKDAGAVLAGRE